MEKIRLNGFEFYLKNNGVKRNDNNKLHLSFKSNHKSLEEIENVFNNKDNTKKISVVDALGETIEIINDYVNIKSIKKELTEDNEYTVSVTLEKEDIAEKVERLEELIDKVIVSLGLILD